MIELKSCCKNILDIRFKDLYLSLNWNKTISTIDELDNIHEQIDFHYNICTEIYIKTDLNEWKDKIQKFIDSIFIFRNHNLQMTAYITFREMPDFKLSHHSRWYYHYNYYYDDYIYLIEFNLLWRDIDLNIYSRNRQSSIRESPIILEFKKEFELLCDIINTTNNANIEIRENTEINMDFIHSYSSNRIDSEIINDNDDDLAFPETNQFEHYVTVINIEKSCLKSYMDSKLTSEINDIIFSIATPYWKSLSHKSYSREITSYNRDVLPSPETISPMNTHEIINACSDYDRDFADLLVPFL